MGAPAGPAGDARTPADTPAGTVTDRPTGPSGPTSGSVRPRPLSDTVRDQFRRQRTRDTGPELALRRELHHRGMRFRVDRTVLPGQRFRADIVFGPSRVAVFVDGCFWHGCPLHGNRPKNNSGWWDAKLTANTERDHRTDGLLTAAGWAPVRTWEHEDPTAAADRIEPLVRVRRGTPRPPRAHTSPDPR